MDKQQLSELFAKRNQTDCDLQQNDPQLWAAILATRGERLRQSILDALKSPEPKIRERIGSLDFSQVDSLEVVSFVQQSLDQAGFDPKDVQKVVTQLQSVSDEQPPPDCQPLTANPEIALLLEKARLFEIARVAGLDDAIAEKAAAEIDGPHTVNDATLQKLVDAGQLTTAQASQLGLAAALYQLTDDNASLAIALRSITSEHLQGKPITSTRDLASLRTGDWEAVLSDNKMALPNGVSRKRAATVFSERFAALHPDVAFVARLPTVKEDEIPSAYKNLEPLVASNPKVMGVDFKDLKLDDLAPDQVKQLETSHVQLGKLVRAYPGLRLAEVLDDQQRTPVEKAATVAKRVSLFKQAFDKLGTELFALDYSPGSPDLDRLELTKLDAGDDEQAMVLTTLKSYQRSYALTGHVDDAMHLIERGFTSSADIAAHTFSEFQAAVTFDPSRAQRYWTDARATFVDSTLMLGSIIDLRWGLFDDLFVANVRPNVHDYLRRLDGYETLFGSLSFCACQHCQSILGPAAYFVDLMKFVDDHIRPQFASHRDHVLDLHTRRPDLWVHDLTCACKDERIPTLDVVNEILEDYIARSKGLREIGTNRADLLRLVYGDALLSGAHSFVQPFHLSLARVETYLAKLASSRAAVVRALGIHDSTYARSILGLSLRQWQLITGADTDLVRLGRIYGIAFGSSGTLVAAVDAQRLLARTGLSREELGQLVTTSFVAAGGASVSIRSETQGPDSVQNDIEKVHGLTADALDRMHRFARLSQKLPWSIAELDRVLNALGDRALSETSLPVVASVREVQMRLGISVDETIALFGPLPQSPARISLFDRLFNSGSFVVVDDNFPKPTVHFIHPALRTHPPDTADPALPRLLAGLQVDLDELDKLIRHLAPHLASETDTRFDPATRDEADRYFVLSAANLTLLYRHARLARALSVSIDELFRLIRLADLPGFIGNLDSLMRLLDFHSWWKNSGYGLDDLAVLTGAPPSDATAYPDPERMAEEIVVGASDALSFSDTVFAGALGIAERASRALINDNSHLFVAVREGQWRLADGIDLSNAVINFPTATTIPVPPSGSRPLHAEDIRDVLKFYLPQEVLLRRLATALRINDVSKVRALVSFAGRDLAARDLSGALRGQGPIIPIRELVATLRPYTIAFRSNFWDGVALELVGQRPELFVRTGSGPTVSALRALSVYTRLASRRGGTTTNAPLVDPADVRAAFAAFDNATSSFTNAIDVPLARVIGVSPALVQGLRGRVSPAGPAALALDRLTDACLLAHSLGVDAQTLVAIASDDFVTLSQAADALLASYGTRFTDEAERQKQLSIVEEPLREHKRDALVAYLLYSLVPNPSASFDERPFNSRDELYTFFLIDVEAGGCATTSCIVSAISSVQLYIHRVIMNLEQDRREPSDPAHVHLRIMPPEAIAEWTWRKNYRVWEANRKIFLWPENYIEPDLRDDKTPLFQELESELLQTDITDQNVLDAYTKYIRGFEEVASLTITGAYHDVRVDGAHTIDVLHLFGAASTDPPTHYYRTGRNLIASGRNTQQAAMWSPWQKIEVQITGRRVSPVVFLERLHLFWTEIKTRPLTRFSNGNSEFNGYQHTMSVRFTTLRPDGTWTAPQAMQLPASRSFGPGRGVIIDRLSSGPERWPRFGFSPHPEPVDDYTLEGPNWEGLWLRPGAELEVVYRNFVESGKIDLFARRIEQTHLDVMRSSGPGFVLLHGGITKLYLALADPWVVNTPGMANAVIDSRSLDFVARENSELYSVLSRNIFWLELADMPRETRLLALSGREEDAIAQVKEDVILLQGSATDNNDYVARRIGTTLAQTVARKLFTSGIDGLLDIRTQRDELREAALPLTPVEERLVDRSNHDQLDFKGPYGVYYRELFLHIPFLIANALNSRGRFAAAQRWYHYVFDPTATESIEVPVDAPREERTRRLLDRVWRYLEFRDLDVPRMREFLTNGEALAAYHENPFNPHAIARLRLSAYQKAIVMKYVDNLLDWADHLFTQFTTESVNEALMLYVMAADILGPRPARLGDCGEGAIRPKNYQTIAPTIGRGEELLIELESWTIGKRAGNLGKVGSKQNAYALDQTTISHTVDRYAFQPNDVKASSKTAPAAAAGDMFRGFDWKATNIGAWGPQLGSATTQNTGVGLGSMIEHQARFVVPGWISQFSWSMLRQVGPAFCIPANKDLLAYWDRVESRLYNIRHCLDINGERRELALIAPEIDPRLLVRMRAAGLTLEDVLGTTSGSLPPYRFLYLVDRAKAFAASLSSFGAALLSALEKKDSEEMGRLRLVHQQNLSRMTTQLRRWDISAAEDSVIALERQKEAAEYRREFYQGLANQERNPTEGVQAAMRHLASSVYIMESLLQFLGGVTALIPQSGVPFIMKYGGVEISGSLARFANSINATAKMAEAIAASTGLEAGFQRRKEGWQHQQDLAQRDVQMLDKQVEAARIRKQIAERSLEIHEEGIEQLDELLELTDGKFSNLGRYTWLSTRLRRLYRDAYQNAMALARLAEQAFRFERDEETSPGLAASHWDATNAGLLAGEQLLIDLQNLERRFLETNYRSLEMDQAFALSQVSPAALIQLRETGECRFTIPELFFSLYYPGHYKRRIKAVRLTIPSITGPYVNVSATLTLEGSRIRPTAAASQGLVEVPPRRSVSVATSTAQNDAGVFELSFRDERYMPFEGAGAISDWHLTLPKAFRQFDYQTITEVILSISYTAEHDGALRDRVEAGNALVVQSIRHYLSNNSVARLFSLRQDFSNAFTRLLHSDVGTSLSVVIDDRHFPAYLRGQSLRVQRGLVLLRTHDASVPAGFQLTIDGVVIGGFTKAGRPGDLPGQDLPSAFTANLRNSHTLSVTTVGDLAPAAGVESESSVVDPDKLLDILLYVEYRLAGTGFTGEDSL
jgi:hypothetical protein